MHVLVQNGHSGSIGTERCHARSFCIVWLSNDIVCRRLESIVQSNSIPLNADDTSYEVALPTGYTETVFTLCVESIFSGKHDGAGIVRPHERKCSSFKSRGRKTSRSIQVLSSGLSFWGDIVCNSYLWTMADILVPVRCLFTFTGSRVPTASYLPAWSYW